MIKEQKVIAIITARGGSKGLPKKNIRTLHEKPLIAWTIESALASQFLDKVIVTTDCEEIAKTARKFGAEVPFIRPAHLAEDDSASFDAIEHALEFNEYKNQYDILVLLEPTSPLREAEDIDNALEKLINLTGAKSIVGISLSESQNPSFLISLDEQGMVKPLGSFNNNLRRQDLENVYFLEGTIYASWIKTYLHERGFYHEKTAGYIVPKWKSFEVDDIVDWYCIDAIMKNIKEIKNA